MPRPNKVRSLYIRDLLRCRIFDRLSIKTSSELFSGAGVNTSKHQVLGENIRSSRVNAAALSITLDAGLNTSVIKGVSHVVLEDGKSDLLMEGTGAIMAY